MALKGLTLVALVLKASVAAENCTTMAGLEAVTCQWQEESQKCIAQKCQECFADECLKCQKDSKLIHSCCKENSKESPTPSPLLCKSAALAESIKSCFDATCNGCLGLQCQECHKQTSTITKCCDGDFHNVELPEICGRDLSGPCSGLTGQESLTCRWNEEVNTCMNSACKCSDDQTEDCSKCHQDMAKVSSCCDQHRFSTQPPRICTDAILTEDVMSCIDEGCSSCASESACKSCKEDMTLVNQCCIDHKHGLPFPPMCKHISKEILP